MRNCVDRKATIIDSDSLILMYHDIYKRPRSSAYDHFYVSEDVFAQQLDALLGAGYNSIPLSEITSALQAGQKPQAKSFAVTFDDGYSSFASIAAPILASRNVPATVFLVSEMVGGKNDWVEKDEFQTDPLMSWDEIISISKSMHNIDFQAHTANHVRLADIPIDIATTELVKCKQTIEYKLGKPVDTICYPWGSVNDAVVNAAKSAGYKYGVTTQFGRLRAQENLMLLPRVAMHHVPWLSLKFGPRWPNFWWRIKTRKDSRP